MSDFGALGLPRHFPTSESAARANVYFGAIQLPAVRKVAKRLAADQRFQGLLGKLIACGVGGRTVDEHSMAAWWAWRANEVGIKIADSELESFLAEDEIDSLACIWLFGVFVTDVVHLTDGIELWPIQKMPFSSEKVEFINHNLGPLGAIMPSPRAALVARVRLPKIAEWPPRRLSDIGRRLHFLVQILNLLPHVAASICCACNYHPDGVAPGVWSGGGSTSPVPDTIIGGGRLFENSENIDIGNLLDAFMRKTEQELVPLSIAIQRIQSAKGRIGNPSNKALDLGIALERILLENMKGDQLSLSFRLRGAWLIGENEADRAFVYRVLKEIYEIRSSIAHFGASKKFKSSEPYQHELADHFRVAERIARKIVLDGTPDWDTLILGGDLKPPLS